jgi:hypothetical protein
MRWTRDKEWPPNDIMRIQRQRFLWRPITAFNELRGRLETRWLERATYLDRVVYGQENWTWEPLKWLDTPGQEQRAREDHAWPFERYDAWLDVRQDTTWQHLEND